MTSFKTELENTLVNLAFVAEHSKGNQNVLDTGIEQASAHLLTLINEQIIGQFEALDVKIHDKDSEYISWDVGIRNNLRSTQRERLYGEGNDE